MNVYDLEAQPLVEPPRGHVDVDDLEHQRTVAVAAAATASTRKAPLLTACGATVAKLDSLELAPDEHALGVARSDNSG